MKYKAYAVVLLILTTGLQSNAREKFVLEGYLTGFENGTKLMISPALPNMDWDRDHDTAVYLANGRFTFEYSIKEPTKFSLRVLPKIPPDNPADFEAVAFWAENKPMKLTGQKGSLQFAEFSGSEIQDEYEEFVNIGKDLQQINKRIKDSVLTHNLSEEARIPLRKITSENNGLIEKWQTDFIYSNPGYLSCVAELVFYINFIPDRISKNRASEFYQKMSYDYKSGRYGAQIKSFIGKSDNGYKELKTGDRPFLFSLPDSSGATLQLANIKDKIIFLDFWASGCGPCRLEHKNMVEIFQRFHSRGLEIVSVSQDQSKRLWMEAMQRDNMIWKSVWDTKREVTRMYRVTAIPANYLIGKDGIIIDKDLSPETLAKKLEVVLAEN